MKLLPQPQHMELREGYFHLGCQDRVTLDADCPISCLDSAGLLCGEIKERTGIPVMLDRRSGDPHRGIFLRVADIPGSGKEAYTLSIAPEGVSITGSDEAGLLYGVQTLRQILRQAGGMLPCLYISDYPSLPVRGLFYDVTRCRIPTMDFLKELADRCSFYKMNQLHLYIEHTYLFDGLSEVWRDDTPLTAQQILELDAYCRKLYIDLVPSIATLGHLYKVLRTRTYRGLSEIEDPDGSAFSFYERMAHHTLDVTQEASEKLVFRMIDEYAALFTSKLFNINGDEPFDLGRGRGKALADQEGSHRMYVDWLGKVARHVRDIGRVPMFWGDVILADPESIHDLPEDIVCMNWDYGTNPPEKNAKALAETGVAQYLCPGAQGWKQTINLFGAAYLNISRMARYAHKYHAQGLLVTEWGDFGHLQDPESSVPGILYAAEMGWNANIPAAEAMDQTISVLEYGDPAGEIMSTLEALSRQAAVNWGVLVEFAEISQGHMPDKTMEQFWADYGGMMNERVPKVEQMNRTIERCQEEICHKMPGMEARTRMYPYLLMSDGQKLFNRFANLLWRSQGKPRDRELAESLEIWYNSFKARWRATSAESELYRIGEVIFWMADTLRSAK